jgi:hypothetical protein
MVFFSIVMLVITRGYKIRYHDKNETNSGHQRPKVLRDFSLCSTGDVINRVGQLLKKQLSARLQNSRDGSSCKIQQAVQPIIPSLMLCWLVLAIILYHIVYVQPYLG